MPAPGWMGCVLRWAACYNLLWGSAVILAPSLLFRWAGAEVPRYPELWQCVGMMVGVYGAGYAIAAGDPYRHWPIVLVGLLGKVLGPIGFLVAVVRGSFPVELGVTILLNDLIWWFPFAAILWGAWRQHSGPQARERWSLEDALHRPINPAGQTLGRLSSQRPQLVVFLRHFGCTFCREALADLRKARNQLESQGVGLVVFHMGSPEVGSDWQARAQLGAALFVSDPQCRFYEAFDLRRGTWSQLFGWKSWVRAVPTMLKGHGLGKLVGDGFRMPGVFLVDRGQVVMAYRHRSAADRPNYVQLTHASCQATAVGNCSASTSIACPL